MLIDWGYYVLIYLIITIWLHNFTLESFMWNDRSGEVLSEGADMNVQVLFAFYFATTLWVQILKMAEHIFGF